MDTEVTSLIHEIIAKLRNPIFLFAISFGLILVAIGVYDYEKMSTLIVPLVVVFILGLVGSIFLHVQLSRQPMKSVSGMDAPLPTGIKELLPNRNATSQMLFRVSSSTRKVKILAISGLTSTLSANIYEKLAPLKATEIRCLLLSPTSAFVDARVAENPSRSLEGLKSHIRAGIDLLKTVRDQNSLKQFHVRTYDEMAIFRILLIDDLAYFSYYPAGPADNVPVFVVERGKSWLYDALERYFDSIWGSDSRSKEVV